MPTFIVVEHFDGLIQIRYLYKVVTGSYVPRPLQNTNRQVECLKTVLKTMCSIYFNMAVIID